MRDAKQRAGKSPARVKLVGNVPPLDIRSEVRKLPKLNPAVVDAVQSMLVQDQGMFRPPVAAARLLALCVELYRQRKPLPHRRVMAEVVSDARSIFTVDTAINNALADGYVSLVVETTEGNRAKRRQSVRKERYLIPSERLKAVVEGAK